MQILETYCRHLGWTCAQLWTVDRDAGLLRRNAGWCDLTVDAPAFMEYEDACEANRDAVQTAIRVVEAQARERGVIIEASMPEQAVTVTGDATRLQQVVWNLLAVTLPVAAAA